MNNLSGFLSFHGNVSGQMGSNLITNVEANPPGTPTEILATIRVGDIIYSIPSGGGGGGGTNNYNDLLNKPKINNVILSGDLSLSDLGIYNPVVMTGATASSDGAAGYAPRPVIGDETKFLRGDGTWTDVPGGESLVDKTWTLLATQIGGTLSNTIDISAYDYLVVVIDYQSECYMPQIIDKNVWYKIADEVGHNDLAYGLSWKVSSNYDDYYVLINSQNETAQIYAKYNGLSIILYGIV